MTIMLKPVPPQTAMFATAYRTQESDSRSGGVMPAAWRTSVIGLTRGR